jgi:histidinol-phosphate aminotransferase
VVVIDEAYVDFADADCMDFALAYDNVLCVRTLSKSFSLAAIRVGYAVGNEELIGALGKIKDSYNVNTLSQVAAKAALNDLAHMRGNVERIKKDRERLHGELSALGFAVVPSQANFLWAKHPGMESTELYKQLRERAILVRHFDGPLTRDYLRITIGTSAEMHRLVETLEAILAE